MANNNADMGFPFVLFPSGMLVINAQVRVRKSSSELPPADGNAG